jgi:hypothetical protein
MGARLLLVLAMLVAPVLASPRSDYQAAVEKFALIGQDALKPGAHVDLGAGELNAYVRHKVPEVVAQGVRNPRLELGWGRASGSALIDFAKVREAQGKPPGWLLGYLLEGERPVRVTARLRSSGGMATVDVEQVEISGITIEGRMLDFLIHNYLHAVFPKAKVGQPFALGHHIERLDVQPSKVEVIIGR